MSMTTPNNLIQYCQKKIMSYSFQGGVKWDLDIARALTLVVASGLT